MYFFPSANCFYVSAVHGPIDANLLQRDHLRQLEVAQFKRTVVVVISSVNRSAQEFAMLINLATTSSPRMQKIHPHILTPLNVLAIQDKEGVS